VLYAFDRQEREATNLLTAAEVTQLCFGAGVQPIATVTDLITYLSEKPRTSPLYRYAAIVQEFIAAHGIIQPTQQ
jgi:hypothetical protein